MNEECANYRPYFKGQKPQLCGHYYPDVVRVRDEIGPNGSSRVLDCEICDGIYRIHFDPNDICLTVLASDELLAFRERERARLSKLAG